LGHHIRLVQNDELEALCKDASGFGKAFDLITNNINTSIVGGIQLANGELPCHIIVEGYVPPESASYNRHHTIAEPPR
jgi:hypothetical protein